MWGRLSSLPETRWQARKPAPHVLKTLFLKIYITLKPDFFQTGNVSLMPVLRYRRKGRYQAPDTRSLQMAGQPRHKGLKEEFLPILCAFVVQNRRTAPLKKEKE